MGYSEGETAPMPAHETASQDITVDVPTRPMINDAGDSDAELEREKVLADAGDDKNDEFSVPPGYRMLYLGVHRVVHSPPPSFSSSFSIFFGGAVTDRFRGLVKTIPSVAWFFREVYNVNPSLSAIDIGLELLTTLSPTAGLYINDRMLNLIETGLRTSNVDTQGIASLLAARSLLSVANILVHSVQRKISRRLQSQVKLHFRYLRLRAELAKTRGYLPEEEEGEDENSGSNLDVYRTANQVTEFGSTIIATFSETILAYRMLSGVSNSRLAPMMLASWVFRALPVFDSESNRMWTQGYIHYIINKDWLRLTTIKNLSRSTNHRQDIVCLNLSEWIIKEYERCRDSLQNSGLDLSSVWQFVWGMESSFRTVVSEALDEWPTLYYAFSAMFGWSTFSFATISSVQNQSYSLRWKFAKLFGSDDDSLPDLLNSIHKYASAMQISPDPDEDASPYPCESTSPAGMGLEFRDVTYNYPGNKSKEPAIKNLSFTIKPGQLVILVGHNGSGKTSVTKLLTRLLEPTSGTVLIDGQPAHSFKHRDLREATAFLSQDHSLFNGFSIAEDIGLGRWRAREQRELIEECLHLGGAHTVVAKLKKGSNTVLTPEPTKSSHNVEGDHPLRKLYDRLEKSNNVSGGEKQRLVAARTFMRIKTGDVKLVVVDEPSAAMDPVGEYELFKHLREARAGKTTIFITHRFGHLTRHADVILCMKDGHLVEQGAHAKLISQKGEYFKLFEVQAQAFRDEDSSAQAATPEVMQEGA